MQTQPYHLMTNTNPHYAQIPTDSKFFRPFPPANPTNTNTNNNSNVNVSKRKKRVHVPPLQIYSSHFQQIHDELCTSTDCLNDCYQQSINEILLYKLTKQFSLRVISIKNVKVRIKQQTIIINNSLKYSVFVCQNNNYHLTMNKKRVMMVREGLELIAKVHGDLHLDGGTMKEIIRTQFMGVCASGLDGAVMQFGILCPYCRHFFSQPQNDNENVDKKSLNSNTTTTVSPISKFWHHLAPLRIDYQSESSLQQILTYSKSSHKFPYYISPNIHTIQQSLQQVKSFHKNPVGCINVMMCQADTCTADDYQQEYMVILYYLKYKMYPLVKMSRQNGKFLQVLNTKVNDFQIRLCNEGTEHLWNIKRGQRVLMRQQARNLIRILHNGVGVNESQANTLQGRQVYHRDYKMVKYLLFKQTAVYPYNVRGMIKRQINQCQVCRNKKFYAVYKRPDIRLEITEMEKFKHDTRTQRQKFRYTKSLQQPIPVLNAIKKQQLGAKDDISAFHEDAAQVINQAFLQAQKEQDYTPEVAAMLKKYQMIPELLDFFKNDLLWLKEFGDKKYAKQVTDDNIWVRKHQFDGMYRLVLITTQLMRKSYYLYGEILNIDFVPMMIKRRSPSGRHFQIGFLTGLDKNNTPILFGICFMSEDLMIYHRKMLQFFFESVNDITPGSIVTGSGKNLSQAIALMKKQQPYRYRFNHYINWFYIVQDLKRDLKSQYDKTLMLHEFCRLLSQPNPILHQKKLIQITSQIVQRGILQAFVKNKNNYCLSCLPNSFMGYAMSTTRVQNFYNLLMDNFIYQSKLSTFMWYVFEFQKKLNNKPAQINSDKNLQLISQTLLNQLSDNEANIAILNSITAQQMKQITDLSEYLAPNPLKFLLASFIQSLKLPTPSSSSPFLQQNCDAFFMDKDNLKYSVRYCPEDQCWRCSCSWIYWTGIPCAHIIKMVTKYGGSLRYYVSERWLGEPGEGNGDGDGGIQGEGVHQTHFDSIQGEEGLYRGSKFYYEREESVNQNQIQSNENVNQEQEQKQNQQIQQNRNQNEQQEAQNNCEYSQNFPDPSLAS